MAGVPMSDMNRDATGTPRAEVETARWARIEQGVRQDAARLARLVLAGQAAGYEAQLLARRIDSVRTEGIGAEY
jgi:hypothetical protein